jgi:signal transduction histidine kinase/DNA-binding response OmpR family regulator
VVTELTEALRTGEEYEFQYEGTKGTGNAYVTTLEQTGWVLIQTYPSQVTSNIIWQANRAGIILLVELIAVFVVCIALIRIADSIQKKRLIRENREQSYVVNGTAKLFRAFIHVDLEAGTYQYLAGTKPRQPDIPLEGKYEVWREYLLGLMEENEDSEQRTPLYSKEDLYRNLDEDTSYLRREYRLKNGDGKWDSISIICLKRVDGVPTELLFTYQDVTRVKEREQRSYEALREAYQAVESANQAKSNFLSNMSHDIRTPMNAIMGMTAIAAMNINDTERVKDCLNKITLSSQHLLGLINEVLDMSKIESGKLILSEEEFNLSDVVERIIMMLLPQAEAKKQSFKVELADVTHEEVIGDSMRLQQIFVNVLGNAVKFTPEGGHIRLGISEKQSNLHGYGCYVFTFEDDGIGMEDSFIEKLFEPFTRAENSYSGKIEGTGLGMPIVKNIVQLMNGEIQVESKLNEGSTFVVTVYLKLNHSNRDDIEGLEHLTVLVADDDQFACESACGILNEIGMDADWVLSGDEAIQAVVLAHEEYRDYSAVILDWKMPGKDGIETAREIRAKIGEEVPIIILSAYDYSIVEKEAREAGVNAFISKPMFRSRLVYVMKSLILDEEPGYTELEQLQQRDYSGKRVLLVEDNELNMEIAEELLTQAGVQVDKAVNGRQAVERVNEMPSGFYNLVFMDIQMPEMNGYDAAKAIRTSMREDLKQLPIVAMTADAFTDDVNRAKAAGMNGHVSKPVEIEKLLQALDEWM